MQEIVDSLLPKHNKIADSDWILWERKTLNIHRAILQWSPQSNLPFSSIHDQIRNKVSENYKVLWWRGFAFGIILNLQTIPESIELIEDSIDIRDNKKGTWQWIVLVCENPKLIISVHTWMSTFLTPIYEALLNHYEQQGYRIADFKKEKDKAMKIIANLSGLKGVYFQDYEPRATSDAEQSLPADARSSRG